MLIIVHQRLPDSWPYLWEDKDTAFELGRMMASDFLVRIKDELKRKRGEK